MELDGSEYEYQLDEENRTPMIVFQRYRVWIMLLALLVLPVLAVVGMRYYIRRRNQLQQ